MTTVERWTESLGVGVRVMLLDSGLLPGVNVKESRNFTHKPMEHFAQHGSDMATIIAGRDPLEAGVAPYCDLYVAKVVTGDIAIWKQYEQALEWAFELQVGVVSMSFASTAVSRGFSDLIAELDNHRTICCAAYHPKSWAVNDPHVIIAGHLGVQNAFGALTVGEIKRRSPNGGFRTIRGSSVSTAMIAGLAACAKASDHQLNRVGFLAALANG